MQVDAATRATAGPRPDDAAAERFAAAGRDLVVAGVLGTGLFLAALVGKRIGVLDGRMAELGPPAVLLVTAGWYVGSAGTMGIAWLRRVATRAAVPALLRVTVATGAAWVAVAGLYTLAPGLPGRGLLFAVAALAIATVAGLRHRPPLQTLGVRAGVSAVLVAYLTAFAWAGLEKVEAYPLAPFQMYAAPRLDPYAVEVPRLLGTTADGQEVDLTDRAGAATIRVWLADPSQDVVRATVLDLLAGYEEVTGTDLTGATVVNETWRVPEHPAEPEVQLVDREVVLHVQQ